MKLWCRALRPDQGPFWLESCTSPSAVHSACITEESLRIRQQMASEAGPSRAAHDEYEEAEQEVDSPFPEPEPRAMLLADLLGVAAEFDAAAAAEECEQ